MEVDLPENTVNERPLYDLAVIGAGPAGLAAAITAARAGARVLLAERGKLPRHRVCGEFVSSESLGLLESLLHRQPDGLALVRSAPRIREARMFVGGRKIVTPISPGAASIARYDLDMALWRAAEVEGVDARQALTVQSVNQQDGQFVIATSDGEFMARSIVQCAGRWSNLSAPAAVADRHDEVQWIGIKGHFAETAASSSAKNSGVDLYFFEGGYCGVQPVNLYSDDAFGRQRGTRVNASALVRVDEARSLADVFRLHPVLAERSRGWEPLIEPVATSHLVFRKPVPLAGEVLLAGDSAGFVDPFVGDGISLALRSGAMAAQSLVPYWRGDATLGQCTAEYAAAFHARLGPVYRNAAWIRGLLRLPAIVRRPLAAVLEYAPFVTRRMVAMTR